GRRFGRGGRGRGGALGALALLGGDGGRGRRRGRRGCGRLGRGLARGEAGAQRFGQVDDLAAGRGLLPFRRHDLLARDLVVDRGEDALALLVLELGGVVAVFGDLLDQLQRELQLGLLDLGTLA